MCSNKWKDLQWSRIKVRRYASQLFCLSFNDSLLFLQRDYLLLLRQYFLRWYFKGMWLIFQPSLHMNMRWLYHELKHSAKRRMDDRLLTDRGNICETMQNKPRGEDKQTHFFFVCLFLRSGWIKHDRRVRLSWRRRRKHKTDGNKWRKGNWLALKSKRVISMSILMASSQSAGPFSPRAHQAGCSRTTCVRSLPDNEKKWLLRPLLMK